MSQSSLPHLQITFDPCEYSSSSTKIWKTAQDSKLTIHVEKIDHRSIQAQNLAFATWVDCRLVRPGTLTDLQLFTMFSTLWQQFKVTLDPPLLPCPPALTLQSWHIPWVCIEHHSEKTSRQIRMLNFLNGLLRCEGPTVLHQSQESNSLWPCTTAHDQNPYHLQYLQATLRSLKRDSTV